MSSAVDELAALREKLHGVDNRLLAAFWRLSCSPSSSLPVWMAADPRLPAPPLVELFCAIPRVETAAPPPGDAAAEVLRLLHERQQLSVSIIEAKCRLFPDDYHALIAIADRDTLLALLTDLPAELQTIQRIGRAAAAQCPGWPEGAAAFLWSEYLIPWSKQLQLDHLLVP